MQHLVRLRPLHQLLRGKLLSLGDCGRCQYGGSCGPGLCWLVQLHPDQTVSSGKAASTTHYPCTARGARTVVPGDRVRLAPFHSWFFPLLCLFPIPAISHFLSMYSYNLSESEEEEDGDDVCSLFCAVMCRSVMEDMPGTR